MLIKYKNNIDDLVELNIFVGSLSVKKWILNHILPIVYTIVTLGLGVWLIDRYGGLETTNKVLIAILIICNIFIWIRVLVFKRRVFRKSLNKMIEKNPAYIQEKSVMRKEKEFLVQNLEDKKKKVTFKIENVFRVIKKGDHIFVIKKDYSPMLMLPIKSFKNEEEIKMFFKGLEIEQD